jgi:hypothetical protein
MRKEQSINRWRSLEPNQNPLAVMRPIPYKAEGSRYGCCGIRIDGTPEFVDAVLSCLKSLLPGENAVTRLELARSTVKATAERRFVNGDGGEVCYIRLHERGGEAQVMNMRYDRSLRAATEQYADVLR